MILNNRMPFVTWLYSKRVRTVVVLTALVVNLVVLVRSISLAQRAPIWSDFAYVQYVTDPHYLCNSIMILEALHRFSTKADRLMLFPREWMDNNSTIGFKEELLVQARDQYGAKLVPIIVQSFTRGDSTWQDSFTKLLAFNQTQYKRVILLDSDATIQQPMDELFFLPPSTVAMPRAYWLDQLFLSSQLVVIEPSEKEWRRVEDFMLNEEDSGFDMDILNTLYNNTCTIIPHRGYNLLTAEFRNNKHERYLGTSEPWNATEILKEAKFIHFSDWPRPKPWLNSNNAEVEALQPNCKEEKGSQDCLDRNIWVGLYQDFADRRERICGRRYDSKTKI